MYLNHKGERTETASAQFPIWKSVFQPNGQLRAVRKKPHPIMNYEQLLSSFFLCFHWQRNNLKNFQKHCSVCTKKMYKMNVREPQKNSLKFSYRLKNRLNRGIWIPRVRVEQCQGSICSFLFVIWITETKHAPLNH